MRLIKKENKVKKIILPIVFLTLVGCENAAEKQAKLDAQVKQFVETAVKADLIDPASVQLRNLKGFCGEANSKNRLGGYVGFKKFIVLNEKTVIYENERNISTKEFPLGWDKICKAQPKFNDEKQLIKPNFKLPEPVYDAPVIKTNGKTIAITPSELTMDGSYNYIYPELVFRCDENNKLDLILISFMEVAYNDGYDVMVSTKNDVKEAFLLEVKTTDIAQSFVNNNKLLNYLKNNDHVTFAFKAIGGKTSIQSYDLKPAKEALKKGSLKCSW